jgi:hypothetical protein
MFFALVVTTIPAFAGAKKAQVEVGFVGTPPPTFQNVLLNVQAVRINPQKNASPTGGKWQTIPTPPGIGNTTQLSVLQIDLNASQNIPQLFNTAGVKLNTYHTAEILLDPSNPGSLIPNCPTANSRTEGCVKYPLALNNGNVILVTDTSDQGLVAPPKNGLGVLVLQLQVAINQAPTSPGGAYLVTITMNAVPNPTVPNSLLGTVTGMVTVKGKSPTTGRIRPLAVTAETIGTNTAIASSKLQSGVMNPLTKTMCPSSPGGCFTLALPAAGGTTGNGFGTLYDLAVAGGTVTYDAERLLPVYPGQTLSPALAFSVTGGQTLGNISGQITDSCVTKPPKPIIGATLELLIPPDSNSGADCTLTPEQCVTVATANTDNSGNFPLPGTVKVPAQFNSVPVLAKNKSYVMKITAPGYDDQIVLARPSSTTSTSNTGGQCSTDGGTKFTACNLLLTTGFISGTIPIMPPISGQTTMVQVFAEDAGTNNIRSALPMPLSVKSSNPGMVSFNMLNVPTSPPRNFDLFAITIDPYQGFADPYQGHTIAVMRDVPSPAVCGTTTTTFPPDQIIECVGHGSIAGGVSLPNQGMSVVLSKQGVQLTNSIIANQAPNSDASNRYSFCAPADTYEVQEFQLPTPDPASTPLASPTSSPVEGSIAEVTIPPAPLAGGPSPTPTPAFKCPTSCSNPDGSCPGLCNTVIQALPPQPAAAPTM